MGQMRIIITTGIFPPDIGGPATYVEKLAFELKKGGFEVAVITYSEQRTENSEQYNFPIIRIGRGYSLLLRYFLYFWNLLKIAREADIIYAQCPVCSGLPSMLAAKILRKKFVLKITGDYAWEQFQNQKSKRPDHPEPNKNQKYNAKFKSLEEFQKGKYDLLTEIRRLVQKKVAQAAEFIIVPSQYLKRIVRQWGIKEEKIKVIYNAIDRLPQLDISQREAQQKIGLQGDILLSIGRLVPWKGFDALIKIMPDLLRENPNFRLVIIGSGPQKENYQDQITNAKLENKVFLINSVERNNLLLYFRAADCFILNTAYEGFSHIILEAMQMKVPVITTKVGGNPEIIKNDYNGILIEYNRQDQLKEAILKLWLDKDCQQKFIKNSLKELEKFRLEKMIEKTLKVLKI